MADVANDFAAILPEVAEQLYGAPNGMLSTKSELRYGKNGSLSIDLSAGRFYDHERKEGGGVLDLVAHHEGLQTRAEAAEWLKGRGYNLPDDRDDQSPPQRHPESKGPKNTGSPKRDQKLVRTWDYVDSAGQLVFQVCRFEDGTVDPETGKKTKTFRQRRPDGNGGWVWSVKGVPQVPYRLPEVLKAIRQGLKIFYVEGEKASDALWDLGVPATTNAMGAGKWFAALAPFFVGADVCMLPDNDKAGIAHRDIVCTALLPVAKSVVALDLPDLPSKGDVVEWIEKGGTVDRLYDLAGSARPFLPPLPGSRYRALRWEDLDKPGPEYDYLIDDFLTLGEKSVIGGPSRSGKSFLAIHAAMSVARGVDFFGRPTKRGLVIYQAGEGALGIKKRLRAYRKHFLVGPNEHIPIVLLQSPIDLYSPEGDTGPLIAEIKQLAAAYDVPHLLTVIDTLATATPGADENSGRDMGTVMANIARINTETGSAVCLVHHMNAGGTKLRGHTSVYANVDQVIIVNRDEESGVRTVTLDKQKDDEDGIRFQFELLSIELGQKPDGKLITSCVVVDKGEKQRVMAEEGRPRGGGAKIAGNDVIAFKALISTLRKGGAQAPSELRAPLGTIVAHDPDWLAEYLKLSLDQIGEDDTPEVEKRRKESARKAIARAGERLLTDRIIRREKPFTWWTGKPVRGFPETLSFKDMFGQSEPKSKPVPDKNTVYADEDDPFSDIIGKPDAF